jgi:tetratricopeptide (TPR) repeat protein
MRSEQLQDSRVHTTENQPPVQSTSGKWTQSGDPIDTTKLNAAIAAAEKTLQAKPTDAAAKKAVAEAYFERGVALTEARQYASALGDYRRVLKQDPDHAEAKKWIDQIIGIYGMLKKEYPKAGEEPPPLPWKG